MTEVAPFRPCVLIPTYDNPRTIRAVVEQARAYLPDVVVVDDGSGSEGRAAVDALASDGLATIHHREANGGKGAAVKTGFEVAASLGFSHALQVDADGQHDLTRIPTFLDKGRERPGAFLIGYPHYDADSEVPRGRLWARKITTFWVNVEVGRGVIRDAMVGFRLYPLAAAIGVRAGGDRMDFDIEVAVRLAWTGIEVVNMPVPVRYLQADEGGVSHFRLFRDNVAISWLHTRLSVIGIIRRIFRPIGRMLGLGR